MPLELTEIDGKEGSGGSGMAGGGDGKDAADADLRRLEVIEFERAWPSFCGELGRAGFVVFDRDPRSRSALLRFASSSFSRVTILI